MKLEQQQQQLCDMMLEASSPAEEQAAQCQSQHPDTQENSLKSRLKTTLTNIYPSISIYLYLSIYASIHPSIYLYLPIAIYLSISTYLSMHLPMYLSIYASVYLYLSNYLSISTYLSMHLSLSEGRMARGGGEGVDMPVKNIAQEFVCVGCVCVCVCVSPLLP